MSKIPLAEKAEYPALDKPRRQYLGILKERRSYLLRRVHETPDNAASYHEAEAEALAWALAIVDERFKESA